MVKRSIDEIRSRADEFADAFENYSPRPEDVDAPLPPAMAIKLAAWRRDVAERDLAGEVLAARAQGMPWRQIGEAIGTTGEAVRQRYGS